MAKKKYKYKKGSLTVGVKPDGTPQRIWVYGKTKREKDDKLAELKRRYARGLYLGDMSVYDWSERWQQSFLANVSAGQKSHYSSRLDNYILPHIGHMRMRDVRKSHLLEVLNSMSGGKLGSVTKIRHILFKMFNDAVDDNIIELSPATKLTLPDVVEEKRRSLTPDERKIVLEVAKTHKHAKYVLTLLYTGLRRGECIALQCSDIDFTNKRISITKELVYEGSNVGTLTGTKASKQRTGDIGDRIVPIPELLFPVLTVLCEDKEPDELLFPKASGGYATHTAVRWWWDSFRNCCHREAGAPTKRNKIIVDKSPFDDKISPHYFRHTYASDLLGAGVDKYIRQLFLGHADDDVTDRYTTLNDEAFCNSLNLLDMYLNGEKWGKKVVNGNDD